MRAIVEHGWDLAWGASQFVVLHDDNGNTSHCQVLLGTSVDAVVLGNVNGTAENIRRHIADKRYGRVYFLADFRSVDGVVGGNVQVVGIRGDVKVLWDISEIGIGRCGNFHNFAVKFSLFHRFLCPYARIKIGSLLNKEVAGHLGKL